MAESVPLVYVYDLSKQSLIFEFGHVVDEDFFMNSHIKSILVDSLIPFFHDELDALVHRVCFFQEWAACLSVPDHTIRISFSYLAQ